MAAQKFVALSATAILAASMMGAAHPDPMNAPAPLDARRDIALSSVGMSFTTITLNGDAGCANRITITPKVHLPVSDSDKLTSVGAKAFNPAGLLVDVPTLTSGTRAGDDINYRDFVNLCGSDVPGKYKLVTTVTYTDAAAATKTKTLERVFFVKRPSSLTYNAAPEGVKRGTVITHSGRLMWDPFKPGGTYGPKDVRLTLLFKPTGAASYTIKKYVTTVSNGYYRTTLAAPGDGIWRIDFPDNNYRATQIKYDAVDTHA